MSKLTEAVFSMQCSFIAKNAAAWAGDILTLPERYSCEADAKTVARFTDEIRSRLDRLDEWAGREKTTPPAEDNVVGDTKRPYRIDPALPAWDVVPNAERIIAALPDGQRAIIAARLMPTSSPSDLVVWEQEAIAKLLWERFSPDHESEWPSAHAAEYRLAAKEIVNLVELAAATEMPNSAGSQNPDSAEVRHGARADDRTLPGGAGSTKDHVAATDNEFRLAAEAKLMRQKAISNARERNAAERRVEALEAENSKLRELLKPFAREADEYNGWAGLITVDADDNGGTRETWYSINDLRRARAALATAKEGSEG